MDIRELSYILYKIDWMRRISADQLMDFVKDYYEDCKIDNNFSLSIRESIEECGFNGSIYACYEEFLDSEYLDKDYMLSLFDENENLQKEYLEDLKTVNSDENEE